MKRPRIILGTLTVLSLVAGLVIRHDNTVDEGAVLRELAPHAVFSEKNGSPPRFMSRSGEVAFRSYDVVPSIRGYAGPIKVMIVLGQDGTIKGLKVLAHRETRNYVHYMESPAYLGRFIGKSVLDRFEIDRDVDGISRATVSVEALARTVGDSSKIMAEQVYGIRAPRGVSGSRSGWGWTLYGMLFAAALGGYLATRRRRGYQRMRDGMLILSIAVVGIALSAPFSILHVFNLLLFQPASSALWAVIVGSTLLSIILAGRFYCGWLCPFGAISELLARVPMRKWTIPVRTDDRWRQVKYALLGCAAAAVLLFRRPEYGNYETYVTLFSLHGNAPAWALVMVTLAANLRVPRLWCRYLCPVAAFAGLLSRHVSGYPSSPTCPMGNKQDPEMSECIRCNRCFHPSASPAGDGGSEKGLFRDSAKVG